jgi:ribonuclease-3
MNSFDIMDAINNRISSFEESIKDYPHYSKIMKEMENAQKKIGYEFKNIFFLMLAFCRIKEKTDADGKNNRTYKNDTLAQVGDAILDTIISERYFAEQKTKKEIDDLRQCLGKNENLFSITTEKNLISFCYNEQYFYEEAPEECKVAAGNHDATLEAIIGAIYLDGGMDKARIWIYENIIADFEKRA